MNWFVATTILCFVMFINRSNAMDNARSSRLMLNPNGSPGEIDVEDPNVFAELISLTRGSRHGNPENFKKRAIDFGLGRGYSGSQAAKHFLGIAAASYAGGPGRRKRTKIQENIYPEF